MKLIYIAYGNVSVFDSQVVSLLNWYAEIGVLDEIILILGIDYLSTPNMGKIIDLNKKVEVKIFKQYPQYFLIERLTIFSIFKTLKEINNIEKYVIHVRNDVLAHYSYKALNNLGMKTNRMISDVRGAGIEQLLEFSNKNKLILSLKKKQRKQVDKSLSRINNISVVSESLKDYIIKKIGNKVNIKVNSCLSNDSFKYNEFERKLIRTELNINDGDFLMVLSTGGNNAWQNTEETIQSLSNKKYKILNLSKSKVEHDLVINKFVSYNEMFKYLSAADAAIIWREQSVTNKVASPVKFSEYICCGLPVLTNESVDLITNYIETNDCGKILNYLDSIDDNMLEGIKSLDRTSISIKGQEDFGVNTIANQYLKFYEEM